MGLCNTSIPRDTSGCITTTSSIARFVHFPPLGSRIVDDRERSSSTSGTVETRARNFFEKWERNGDIARDVDAAASARHRRERVTRGDVADILARAFAGERAGRRRVRITTVVPGAPATKPSVTHSRGVRDTLPHLALPRRLFSHVKRMIEDGARAPF